jgi:hypothetical protein
VLEEYYYQQQKQHNPTTYSAQNNTLRGEGEGEKKGGEARKDI